MTNAYGADSVPAVPRHAERAAAPRNACGARSDRGTARELAAVMASPLTSDAAPARKRIRSWWTWNLGRIAGIPIRMHVTLVILLAWIAISYALAGAGVGMTAIGLLLV